jgi:hypothetical protein
MEGKNIAKLVGIMFMSRTYSHMAHLKTSSYAKHKALNGFYYDIVGLADSLAEASQGVFGKLDIPYVEIKGNVDDPIGALEMHVKMIENLKKSCKYDFLDNILQEIQALYYATLYLLRELD